MKLTPRGNLVLGMAFIVMLVVMMSVVGAIEGMH
jgi:hypothetical protein